MQSCFESGSLLMSGIYTLHRAKATSCSAAFQAYSAISGVTTSGRSSPYTPAPGCGTPWALNGKLVLKPGLSRLIQHKNTLTGGKRPSPDAQIIPLNLRKVLNTELPALISCRYVFTILAWFSGSVCKITSGELYQLSPNCVDVCFLNYNAVRNHF
jgi:hypothetical protein